MSITYFAGIPFKNYGGNHRTLIRVTDLHQMIECEGLVRIHSISDENKDKLVIDDHEEWVVDYDGAIEFLLECKCENCIYTLNRICR